MVKQPVARLVTPVGQHLDRQPPIVAIQAIVWLQTTITHAKLQGVHLPVKTASLVIPHMCLCTVEASICVNPTYAWKNNVNISPLTKYLSLYSPQVLTYLMYTHKLCAFLLRVHIEPLASFVGHCPGFDYQMEVTPMLPGINTSVGDFP